jgi:autotransporter-associated beta strand protein
VNGGANSGIGKSSSAASNLVIDGGALTFTGTVAANTDRLFTIGENGATINSSGSVAVSFTNIGTLSVAANATPTFTLGGTRSSTFYPVIPDSAGGKTTFSKTNSGTWDLYGANTFTGIATVTAGTLNLLNVNALASASKVVVLGTLYVNTYAFTRPIELQGGILSGSTAASVSAVTLTAANSIIQSSGYSTPFSVGVISDGGNGYGVRIGTTSINGYVRFTAENTYTGPTSVLYGAALYIDVANAIDSSSQVTIGNGASGANYTTGSPSDLRIKNGLTVSKDITLAGGRILVDSGSATYSGAITMTYDSAIGGYQSSSILTMSGSITESGGAKILYQDGWGLTNKVVLGGTNTYTGATNVKTGILQLNNSLSLGTSSGVTVSSANGIFDVTGFSIAKSITLASGLVISSTNGSGAGAELSGSISMSANSTIGASSGATLFVNSPIDQNSTSKLIVGSITYSGTVVMSLANSYTGGTDVVGTLKLGSGIANILPTTGTITVSGTLDLGGYNLNRAITISSPSSSGTLISSIAGAEMLGAITLGGTTHIIAAPSGGTLKITGVVSGSSKKLSIGKAGFAGTVILNALNTYTGGTDISQSGLLLLNIQSALDGTGPITLNGGKLDVSGTTVNNSLIFASSTNAGVLNSTGVGVISGGITSTAASALLSALSGATLNVQSSIASTTRDVFINNYVSDTGIVILIGANSHTSSTRVDYGTLKVGATNAFTSNSGITVKSAALFDLAGYTVNKPVTLEGGTALSSAGSGTITGGLILTTGSTLAADSSATLTVSTTKITGTGYGLTIGSGSNLGTVILSDKAVTDAGSYTGGTSVTLGATLDLKINLACTSSCFNSSYSGAGTIILEPATSGWATAIGATSGASTSYFPVGLFAAGGKFASGFANIVIGNISSGGNLSVTGNAAFFDSVSLLSSANVTINSGASVSTSKVSGNLVVAATGSFINNAGSGALATTGAGSADRWIVYSASPVGNTFGGLVSGNKAYWGSTYTSASPAVIATGNRYVFGDSPTITTTDAQKTYGNTIDLSTNYTLSGAYQNNPATYGNVYLAVTSSDIFATLPTISSTGEGSAASVGTYAITASGAAANTGYGFSYANTGVLTVDPATIVLGLAGVKTYDGNATFTAGPDLVVSGLSAGDALATATANSSQASANGSNYFVSFTLSSGTASNYSLVSGYNATTNSATINKADAYVIIGSGQSSTYGSTPTINYSYYSTASGTGGSSISSPVGLAGTATITNAPSSTSDATTYSLTYASGLSSTNYSFNPAASAVNYVVNPATLVVTGANNSVAYNGSVQMNSGATATVNGSAATITGNSIATGIGSQSFTLSGYGSGTNASATPYADSLLATAGGGTSAGNYNISYTNGGLTINKADAYVIIGSGQSSTYGSTPTITYTFNTNAAGTGSTITTATTGTAVITRNGLNSITSTSNSGTYGVYYTSGLSSANYTFSRATGTVNFVVNPAILDLTISKTYDGSSIFSPTDTYTLSGTLYNGDLYPAITPGRAALTSSAHAATYTSFTSSNLTLDNGNYTLSGGTVSATIDKANAYVIISSGQSSFYGSTPNIAYTFNTNDAGSGSVISSAAALNGLSGTAVITNSPTSSSGAASYDLTYSTGLTSTNYIYYPALNSVNFTVNPKPITLTANARSTTYGTALSLGTTAYSITSGGLNIGETISSVTLKYQGSDTVDDTTNAGTYTNGVVASDATGTGGFNSTNYAITYRAANLTVNKKSVTITNGTSSTTYDGVSTYADLVGSAGFTTTPLAGSDAVGSVAQRTTVGGNVVTGIAQAGTFISTPSAAVLSTGTASNYLFTYTGATNTVAKANLSVIATSSLSGNVYNGNAYTGTYTTTLLGADAITVIGLATGTNAGTYISNLQVSGAALDNYNTPTITNANLVVSPKPLSISAQTALNKTYDATTNSVLNSDSATLLGVVGSDLVVLNTTAAYGNFASADVGNSISVTVQGNTLSGSAAGNYTLSQPTGLSANITKAELTVTADNVVTFIGQGLPSSYTVSYSGFVQGQTAANSGVTAGSVVNSANISSGAGTYTLTPSGFSANNYSISYVTGTYTIAPADTLVVQAGSHAITYGNNVSLTPSSVQYYLNGTGVVDLAYTSSVGNTYTYDDGRGGNVTFTLSPANAVMSSSNNLSFGSYQISGGNMIQSGTINLIGTGVYTGRLSISQQAVTASASSGSKVYDGTTAMNGLSISLSPVISGDQVTAGGSGAFAQSNVGSNINYSISNLALSGADSRNYYLTGGTTFSGSNGVITPATLTYTATPTSSIYGSAPIVNAGAVTGFVAGENQNSATSGTLAFTTPATSSSAVGSYAINGSGLTANHGNYLFSQSLTNASALTIIPAPAANDSLISAALVLSEITRPQNAANDQPSKAYLQVSNGGNEFIFGCSNYDENGACQLDD